ncbi:hypothetical protein [Streptomyces lutosisoli]|uniref:Transcriptional regulator n=2 Tax=Streptomyces lutosisoli TaxID=2665721 RepID=A0ABW2W2Q5_9ACTN
MIEKASGADVQSRWAPAPDQLPDDLTELIVPTRGTVALPLHLAWSGLRTFDLGDEKLLLGMYRSVLLDGASEDCTRYLNAAQLTAHWPILRTMLGRGVRTAWEDRFAQLRPAAAAVISSRPVTAVEPRGVITRDANTPRSRASSAGGSCPASPQWRVSSARHDGVRLGGTAHEAHRQTLSLEVNEATRLRGSVTGPDAPLLTGPGRGGRLGPGR